MKLLSYVIITFFLCFVSPVSTAHSENHLIVIDGGSSGSRAFLFEYSMIEMNGYPYPDLELKTKVKLEAPVTDASFQANPVGYFNQLFNLLEQEYSLTRSQKAQTPVFFMATAGMRSLPINKQIQLITQIRQALQASIEKFGYYILPPLNQQVRIIPGTEEGLYGWLSTQYWNGTLKRKTLTSDTTEPIMEKGGSSAQIAFLPVNSPGQYSIPYYFRNNLYLLYIYSYPGFGGNASIENMLTEYKNGKTEIAACFPKGARYPINNPILTGKGDFDKCSKAIQSIIYGPNSCDDCSKMGVYQPKITTPRATLTANYYHTFSILGIANHYVPLQNLKKNAQKFCESSWQDLKKRYPAEPERYLIIHCFYAAWDDNVLRGYGLSDNSEVLATDSIAGVKSSTDWATGAAWQILVK